jgi:hypothetical protein
MPSMASTVVTVTAVVPVLMLAAFLALVPIELLLRRWC